MPLHSRAALRATRLCLAGSLALQTYLLYFFAAADDEVSAPQNSDKLVHMAMFGGPALLALAGRVRWVAWALLAYAPASEVLQGSRWVGRDGDPLDALFDVSGIIVAFAVAGFLDRRR